MTWARLEGLGSTQRCRNADPTFICDLYTHHIWGQGAECPIICTTAYELLHSNRHYQNCRPPYLLIRSSLQWWLGRSTTAHILLHLGSPIWELDNAVRLFTTSLAPQNVLISNGLCEILLVDFIFRSLNSGVMGNLCVCVGGCDWPIR